MSDSRPDELQYRVVYCSGEDNLEDAVDSNFTDSELLNGKEWISTKYCHYPQELVLKFKRRANMEKIQILCHALYIPQKIEILVGNPGVGDRVSMSKAKYERLGYVNFQNNTDERTRELKSIYVDATGWFLKLLIHNNYKNQSQNPYDQVGILEVVPTGYYLPDKDSENSSEDEAPAGRKNRRNSIPTSKNKESREVVGFNDKNYAEEMRQIVKILERKKRSAVANEKFELAKKLKFATEKIKQAEEEVDKLDRDKREAAEEEDFDSAQDCKDQIVAIRTSVYAEVKLLQLLDADERRLLGITDGGDLDSTPKASRRPIRPASRERPSPVSTSTTRSPTPPIQSLPSLPSEQPPPPPPSSILPISTQPGGHDSPSRIHRSAASPASSSSPAQSRYPSAGGGGGGGNPYDKKENTVLPAITNKNKNVDPGGKDPGGAGRDESDPEHLPPINQQPNHSEEDENVILQSLPERDRTVISQAIHVFGIQLVKDVYSKKWEKRKAGLEALERRLEKTKPGHKEDASYLLQPTLQILRKGLRDKVFAVFSTALDVLTYIVAKFIPDHKLGKSGANTVAEKTHYVIVTRTGDTAGVARAYVSHIMRPFEATGYTKIDQGHAEVAESIVEDNNAPNSNLGLDEHRVCAFALSCIAHTDPEIRQVGARLVIHMYKNGDKETVLQYLPPAGSKQAQRNPLFKAVFDEIDNIDGRTPRSQKDKGGQNMTEEEADLRALQQQNKMLRQQMAGGGKQTNTAKSAARTPRTQPTTTGNGKKSYGQGPAASKLPISQGSSNSQITSGISGAAAKKKASLGVGGVAGGRPKTGRQRAAEENNQQYFEHKLAARNSPRPAGDIGGSGIRREMSFIAPSDIISSSRSPSAAMRGKPGPNKQRSLTKAKSVSPTGSGIRQRGGGQQQRKGGIPTPAGGGPNNYTVKPFEKMCIFCGERNDEFDEKGLDIHYLRACPMLKKCEHCKQMTEISTLKQHLLGECSGKAKYKLCPRCMEPLTPKLYENHQVNRDCPTASPESVAGRCLLCHEDVKPNNDTGWRRHLIGNNGCQGNPRKTLGIGTPQYGGRRGSLNNSYNASSSGGGSGGRPVSSRHRPRSHSESDSSRKKQQQLAASRARPTPTIKLHPGSDVEDENSASEDENEDGEVQTDFEDGDEISDREDGDS